MKRVTVLLALATLGVSGSAEAARFGPDNTAFTISGTMHLYQSLPGAPIDCPYTFGGKINRQGALSITNATFCSQVSAAQLPWAWVPGTHRPEFAAANLSISINGLYCGAILAAVFLKHGPVSWQAQEFPNGCFLATGDGSPTPKIAVYN